MESPSLKQNGYLFLHKPIKIGEQQWGDNTVPLVSISCITYNHESYISKAIEGFLLQETTFRVEILIHDDASFDKTADIVRTYEAKYPELIKPLYEKENQYSKSGYAFSYVELARTQGKYIALCDGDDYWTDPLKLQKQVYFLEQNKGYSMVCHDALVLNEVTGTSKRFFGSEHGKKICCTKDVFGLHFCPTASILYRREALNLRDASPTALAGDMMLVFLMSLNGLLYRMDDVMSVYRLTASGATIENRKQMEKSLRNRIEMYNHFDKVSNFKYRKYIRIEIDISKNRIRFLNSKSKFTIIPLKIYMKILLAKRKRVFTGNNFSIKIDFLKYIYK